MWIPVDYSHFNGYYVMAEDSTRPPDRKQVLVIVEGLAFPFVAYCRTYSDGAFWIILGGVGQEGPFKVTHYADCLPEPETYKDLIKLGIYS